MHLLLFLLLFFLSILSVVDARSSVHSIRGSSGSRGWGNGGNWGRSHWERGGYDSANRGGSRLYGSGSGYSAGYLYGSGYHHYGSSNIGDDGNYWRGRSNQDILRNGIIGMSVEELQRLARPTSWSLFTTTTSEPEETIELTEGARKVATAIVNLTRATLKKGPFEEHQVVILEQDYVTLDGRNYSWGTDWIADGLRCYEIEKLEDAFTALKIEYDRETGNHAGRKARGCITAGFSEDTGTGGIYQIDVTPEDPCYAIRYARPNPYHRILFVKWMCKTGEEACSQDFGCEPISSA